MEPEEVMHDLRAENVADRKSTRLNSSHSQISYAVFCLKKKKNDADFPGSISSGSSCLDFILGTHTCTERVISTRTLFPSNVCGLHHGCTDCCCQIVLR